ncbi:MAG: 50S ribosomal protein L22 [Holosporaceae bacterium]|jgi:large subunit ribosomal protein L22|nr:50S ribosomal protein L22 [Holosporaceae bacterium]
MANRLYIVPTSGDVVARDRMILASPRKVNLVARLIRGMLAVKALDALKFCKRAVARDVRNTLLSAIANAEAKGLDSDLLTVREAYVGKSAVLRRFMPRAKGSGAPIRKRFSNLTVVLCEALESED